MNIIILAEQQFLSSCIMYIKKKCLGALARAHIPLVAQAVWLLHADDGTTKLGPHPNKAVANCWFMTQKCQCQKAARVRLLRRYSYSTHSCDSKSRNIYFPSHVKKTVHHQPTLLHNKIPSPSACTVPTQLNSYSIMEGSLVSRIWSVRIQGMDISMGNWMRRPMVSSRKNSRNQSWDRSQHCCSASEMQEIPPAGGHPCYPHGEGSKGSAHEAASAASYWTGFGYGTFF